MQKDEIQRVLVVGGGTAGLTAALTLKRKLPKLDVKLVRSPAIGVIGVGEGTIGGFDAFYFRELGLDRGTFYRLAQPTWKLGIKLFWGRRPSFNYVFVNQSDWRWFDQERANGFYCAEDFSDVCAVSSLMDADKASERNANGDPVLEGSVYHIQNALFVAYLESAAADSGVQLLEDRLDRVVTDANGVASLSFERGGRMTADLYVDASGFSSELLGRSLEEPFEDFGDTLFCDRALVGGWERGDEVIRPYTTAETMDAGWCWRIDHEHHVNRGYVYSSAFIDDEAAEREFRAWDTNVGELRQLKFRSGHYRRAWVDNVVAIGNAFGFVEPLEATAIQLIALQSKRLEEALIDSQCRHNATLRDLYNRKIGSSYRSVREFLGVHYRLNDRRDTPFWKACRADVNIGAAQELLDAYRETGPAIHLLGDTLPRSDVFGLDGYLTMFLGFRVPYRPSYAPDPEDARRFEERRARNREVAANGMDTREALAAIRDPAWRWGPV